MSAALDILEWAHQSGLEIEVQGGRLELRAPQKPPDELLAEVKAHKPELIALLSRQAVGVPAERIRDLAKLRTVDHFPGFSAVQWQQLLVGAAAFLARWGATADKLGWSTTDLFGCIQSLNVRSQPIRQIGQRNGLVLLIRDGEVVEITADRATIRYSSGSELVYLRRPVAGAVALWDLIH